MAKPKLILDYVYDHEAKLAERVYLTQPVGDDKVIDYTWKQTLDQSRRMAAHIKAQVLEDAAEFVTKRLIPFACGQADCHTAAGLRGRGWLQLIEGFQDLLAKLFKAAARGAEQYFTEIGVGNLIQIDLRRTPAQIFLPGTRLL